LIELIPVLLVGLFLLGCIWLAIKDDDFKF
jgi:hypothetical protein